MRSLLIGLAALLVALGSAGPAAADPYHDIHHPDYMSNWCPGGGLGNNTYVVSGGCRGVPYPDGSFWHQAQIRAWGTLTIRSQCLVNTGGLFLEKAGPGGCGGEV